MMMMNEEKTSTKRQQNHTTQFNQMCKSIHTQISPPSFFSLFFFLVCMDCFDESFALYVFCGFRLLCLFVFFGSRKRRSVGQSADFPQVTDGTWIKAVDPPALAALRAISIVLLVIVSCFGATVLRCDGYRVGRRLGLAKRTESGFSTPHWPPYGNDVVSSQWALRDPTPASAPDRPRIGRPARYWRHCRPMSEPFRHFLSQTQENGPVWFIKIIIFFL